MSAATAARHR